MNNTDTVVLGSCLCGKINYRINGAIGEIVHCHCVTCRKAHASAFSSVVAVADDDFELSGEQHLHSYESSVGKLRYFCRHCASQIYAKRTASTHIILRLGTIDSEFSATEKNHIWTSQQASWYKIDSQLPQCATFE